jgi:hypothetical protein
MKIKRFGAIALLLASLSAPAEPPKSDLSRDASDSLSATYVNCAAYFTVAMQGLKKSNKLEMAAKYDEAAKTALFAGLTYAKGGQSPDLAEKVSHARYSEYLKMMLDKIEHNFSNIAILQSEYSDDCMSAINDPGGFKRKRIQSLRESALPKNP